VHETGGLTRGTLLATLLAAASESAPRAADRRPLTEARTSSSP